ncbi:hypothetical protein [Kitasatospora cheerisanensis]|uniref:hypothetical protein n=1 Tax=Kitasatospora cheerisanensis TaxID=81942 RepID=UPI0012ED7AFA|nr:hypothetical protein [Kitasatospora cheerisanensis]
MLRNDIAGPSLAPDIGMGVPLPAAAPVTLLAVPALVAGVAAACAIRFPDALPGRPAEPARPAGPPAAPPCPRPCCSPGSASNCTDCGRAPPTPNAPSTCPVACPPQAPPCWPAGPSPPSPSPCGPGRCSPSPAGCW